MLKGHLSTHQYCNAAVNKFRVCFGPPHLQYNVYSPLSRTYNLRPKHNVPLQVNDHAQGLPLTHLVGQTKRTLGVVPHPEDVI